MLPALTNIDYATLDGVNNGGMAMDAYLAAISSGTSAERKKQIEAELRAYCALDTEAMMHIWRAFSGKAELAE